MSSSTKQPDSSGCADNLRPAVTTEDVLSDDQKSLLAGVAAGQTLRTAAERAGVYILDAHGWLKDEVFAQAYATAEAAGTDVIEEEAFRRAVKGVEKPVYRAGEVVGHVADYSDAMLMFIGWVCGCALAWHFVGYDLANWLRLAFAPDMPAPPNLGGTDTLVTVLLSMLGLGGLRTVEKLKGVHRDAWKG